MKVAAHARGLLHVLDIAPQFEFKGRAVDAEEHHLRRGNAQHALLRARDSEQNVPHLFGVDARVRRERDLYAAHLVAAQPVLDDARDEIGVGHDHRRAVECLDFR